MANFPLLNSGAVTQYPASLGSGQPVSVIRFLDGSDQRYLTRGRALRQWHIELTLLAEDEIRQIESFVAGTGGDYSRFVFPDPFTGENVPNCILSAPELITSYLAPGASSTSFWILETNG